jgi:Holliday junction resolvase
MLESKIQSQLIKKYEAQGYYVVKIIKANKAGIPDLLLIDKTTGIASWVEVKAASGRISDIQKLRAEELRAFCMVRFVTQGDIDVSEGTIETVKGLGF